MDPTLTCKQENCTSDLFLFGAFYFETLSRSILLADDKLLKSFSPKSLESASWTNLIDVFNKRDNLINFYFNNSLALHFEHSIFFILILVNRDDNCCLRNHCSVGMDIAVR